MNGPQQAAETRPDKSVIEVALSTLDDRLKTVRKRFSQAVRHEGTNAERVHQLRVATRRAAAALGLYHDFVPRKSAKKMDARLKRIRRTAGDIRDCDMLLARFSSEVAQAESPSFIKRTDSQRVAAYRDLCRLHQNHSSSGRLKRQTRKLLAKTRHKAERRPRLATRNSTNGRLKRLPASSSMSSLKRPLPTCGTSANCIAFASAPKPSATRWSWSPALSRRSSTTNSIRSSNGCRRY